MVFQKMYMFVDFCKCHFCFGHKFQLQTWQVDDGVLGELLKTLDVPHLDAAATRHGARAELPHLPPVISNY